MKKSLVKKMVFGTSVEGVPLEAWQIGHQGEIIHFYGGFHGDEPEGVEIAFQLKDYLVKQETEFQDKIVIVVPLVNPDGYKNKTRVNSHKVDLNRNFPTRDWTKKASGPRYYPGPTPASEPEVEAVIELFNQFSPKKIISFHSLIPHQLNYDGPAKELANSMSRYNHYPVTQHIGYPTPGSLGNYAGQERKIALITYELPEKILKDKAWEESREALLEAIRFVLS